MPVHIIRVLRELSDMGSHASQPMTNYFYTDIDHLQAGSWEPNTDICEYEDEVVIRVELAGVSREDISVKVKDNKLYITGIRHSYKAGAQVVYHQVEVHCGEFNKAIALPESIAHNEITASFQNGMLEIKISKQDQSVEIPIAVHAKL